MSRLIRSNVVQNYLSRTVGHRVLRASRGFWRSLEDNPYNNGIFSVTTKNKGSEVYFDVDPKMSQTFSLADRFLEGGVTLEGELRVSDDCRNQLILDTKDFNLPARWADMICEYRLLGNNWDPKMHEYQKNKSYRYLALTSHYDFPTSRFNMDCHSMGIAYLLEYQKFSDLEMEEGVSDLVKEMNREYPVKVNDILKENEFVDINDILDPSRCQSVLSVQSGPPTDPTFNYDPCELKTRTLNTLMYNQMRLNPSTHWETSRQGATPSAHQFAKKCVSVANDRKKYSCDLQKFLGGIEFPLSKYLIASYILNGRCAKEKARECYSSYIDDGEVKLYYRSNGAIQPEDLVVLNEDINKMGGISEVTHYVKPVEEKSMSVDDVPIVTQALADASILVAAVV